MTDLAYMTRDDWAPNYDAIEVQSTVIRKWLGEAPYMFAMIEMEKYAKDGSVDIDTSRLIAPDSSTRAEFDLADLGAFVREGKSVEHAVVVLHPRDERSLETVREAVNANAVSRLFVMVWWPLDVARIWLDSKGAINLSTGRSVAAPDPLMVEACSMMIDHQYNGLSSGRGKEAVVQLVRAFNAQGYPFEVDSWLRAYFAAGGEFRHAESIRKLVTEMKSGVKHRVQQRYVDNIFDIIQDRQSQQGS